MHSSILGLSLAALLAPAVVFAQSDEVERGPVPDWVTESDLLPVPDDVSGMIFVRRQDTLIHLDDTGQSTFLGQTLRLIHPQALQLGNISLAWNPAAGNPIVHRLEIHRDGTIIDLLDSADFEILRREDQLEQAVLDGTLTAVFQVPDLRVGDELEFAATTQTRDPTMGANSFGLLFLSPTPPPGRIRLGVSWEDGQKPNLKIPDAFQSNTTFSDHSLDFRFDNAEPANPPKDAPPRYSWGRIAQYSDFATWETVSRFVSGLFADARRPAGNSTLDAEIARIAAAYSDPSQRMEAALQLVQQQVRYVYVGLDGGNFRPASADDTWNRRYGDCKGKTALLLALLDGLGIRAEAVLASNNGTDDGLDQRLPSPAMFDHVLVRANIGSQTYWLDGTLPGVFGASAEPLLPYRWVLPVSSEGSALEGVPFAPPSLPLEMGLYEIDAREGFDSVARLVSTTVSRGVRAIAQYNQLSTLSKDQLLAGFRANLAGSGQWDEIRSVEYQFDPETKASILTIEGTGQVDWDDDGDGAYSLSLPGGGFSPPSRRQRPSDQDQSAPYYSEPSYTCYATTLRLPDETSLKNWGFNSVFDTMMFGRLYYRMMEKRDDRTIRMVRGYRIERQEITPVTARKDNDRIANFDNSKANVYFDPTNEMKAWGQLSPVPATYEIGWLGADAPCLPKDVLEDE